MADPHRVSHSDEQPRVIRCEPKPEYRADTNQNGRWFVWRRISATGWASHCVCESGEAARAMVDRLNASAGSNPMGA